DDALLVRIERRAVDRAEPPDLASLRRDRELDFVRLTLGQPRLGSARVRERDRAGDRVVLDERRELSREDLIAGVAEDDGLAKRGRRQEVSYERVLVAAVCRHRPTRSDVRAQGGDRRADVTWVGTPAGVARCDRRGGGDGDRDEGDQLSAYM